MINNDLNKRICIIGAGAAGLVAAETLKSKGYQNITILEKEDHAGGKCSSFEYEGRSYELGAGVIAANNHTIQNLAKKFAIKMRPINFSIDFILLDTKTGLPISKKSWKENLNLFQELFLKYWKLSKKYHKVTKPGLSQIDSDLFMPFSEWSEKHKISSIAKEFANFFTGFGYGYFDEIPAAYVLKYYSLATLKSFLSKKVYCFEQGIQTLWTTVAKNHHVIFNAKINKIVRNGIITVITDKNEFQFDELIIASPLDDSLKYLDATEAEKDLFSKISYCDYRTYACFINNFPRQDGYLPGNFNSSKMGHPVLWYNRYPDSNLYTFYILGDFKIADEEALKNIEHVVHQLGGTLEKVHRNAHWKYFPHVSPTQMKDGYFKKLEKLQGQNQTYYVGELLNFSTVELSSEYAKKLVLNFF